MSIHDPELGNRIAEAAESNDIVVAASTIRGGEFILFQQIDPDGEEGEQVADGSFCAVLAEVDEETAVICFSDQDSAQDFANELRDEIPENQDLPCVLLDGNTLLDALPAECGLLVNPGALTECYFPPGSFV